MHRRYFDRFGEFDLSYRVAMDLELFLRGMPAVGTTHVPVLVARVRTGGLQHDPRHRRLRRGGAGDGRDTAASARRSAGG